VHVESMEEVEHGVDLEGTGARVPAASAPRPDGGPGGNGADRPGEPIGTDRHR
jgi:hypothetical protein